MTTEEDTWEQKEEPGGGGGGGGEAPGVGSLSEEGARGREDEEMMEEEEEEERPKPKVAPAQPNAPKKEHVNVVFIGHVGASLLRTGVPVFLVCGSVYKRGLSQIGFVFLNLSYLCMLSQTPANQLLEDRSCE